MGKSETLTDSITTANADLVVGPDDKENWMRSENRRHGFHNLSEICRNGWMIRAPRVLALPRSIDRRISDLPSVHRLTGSPYFSGMAVVRGQELLFEDYAGDFGPDRRHSIQSISKTTISLMIGKLVEDGRIDLSKTVSDYLPDIGSGYAGATVQDVLDMNVVNIFVEDYSDSYRKSGDPSAIQGYNRLEIAMGWRLPPDGEAPFGLRDFVNGITSDDVRNPLSETLYKSSNTEVLAWIAETVTGESLYPLLVGIVEAAGIEGALYMSTDINGAPVVSGGGALTARDLARYGLLFARGGVGVSGSKVGSRKFINAARSGQGTACAAPLDWLRYSNQLFTNGEWIGHLGFCGQLLMIQPESETAIVYFSVLEEKNGDDDGWFEEVVRMGETVLAHVTG
jgi:CubicO group peptidase (beta-lactamase class C family)